MQSSVLIFPSPTSTSRIIPLEILALIFKNDYHNDRQILFLPSVSRYFRRIAGTFRRTIVLTTLREIRDFARDLEYSPSISFRVQNLLVSILNLIERFGI
jgi:hypothetical protein